MSGGHYDYATSKILGLVNDIQHDIETLSVPSTDRYGFENQVLEPEAIAAMLTCVEALKRIDRLAHSVEWFMSGDYGLDTLVQAHERFKGETP